MNVGQLRAALEGVADDVIVVTDAEDHSYNEVWGATATTGLFKPHPRIRHKGEWTEDLFAGPMGEATAYGVRKVVFKVDV